MAVFFLLEILTFVIPTFNNRLLHFIVMGIYMLCGTPILFQQLKLQKKPGFKEALKLMRLGNIDAISEEIASRNSKKCPMCAENVLSEAKICKHCGSSLDVQN
jgi:hypothetical protein